jgi:capsular polysaccharide biosynthesis protein
MVSEKDVNGITLHDILTSILKGWKLLLCIVVIVIAIGSFYTFKIKKIHSILLVQ